MQKLRGSGSTFSTSGKAWRPFIHNPRIAAQNAKRARIVANGHGGTASKSELRALADQAVREHKPRRVPGHKPPR